MFRPSIRPDAVLVQAVIAGALSFAHLHDLAAAAGQTGWKAWAYPISVDLLLVASWRRLRGGGRSRLAWCWFLIALVASLGANVSTAGFLDLANPPAWLRFTVAGWPALAFLGGTLLAHTPTQATAAPADSVPADDLGPELVERDQPPAPEPAPALPAPAPAPVPSVPPALVEHARKVADDHRTRTGSEIDPDTLRARLGVPAPMADAIAAQLA
ncbi:SpdA protein [Streptomyces agglomeratus]|uniref:DUF2637 domain-containing protein n=1 Tax=Streptomyces agglomeratus TaxID=285458 RepID=UPI000854A38B|nr:DUF2637 domain-containing protein [Streptomyces agglomeratus]OEJ41175.1 SpdA protein [Streptomyces agglomeratus]OEJ48853.1 SpdA protein [Streptomyces agglomeratus]